MEITILREELHKLINSSSEEKLLQVYSLFEEGYPHEFKMMLEEEYTNYKTNGEVIDRHAVDDAVKYLLQHK
jgi:outer membrane lipopolysaccharide assembly protein LptE/RlpB